eukprot:6190993-Pleurochrysis_carterae.AAC.1
MLMLVCGASAAGVRVHISSFLQNRRPTSRPSHQGGRGAWPPTCITKEDTGTHFAVGKRSLPGVLRQQRASRNCEHDRHCATRLVTDARRRLQASAQLSAGRKEVLLATTRRPAVRAATTVASSHSARRSRKPRRPLPRRLRLRLIRYEALSLIRQRYGESSERLSTMLLAFDALSL